MNISFVSPIGYAYFILRQLPDWEENAYATHGFTDAIQAPVNTDGDKAVITETCYPYPFRYWNAGTSWMIISAQREEANKLVKEIDDNAAEYQATLDELEADEARIRRQAQQLQKQLEEQMKAQGKNYNTNPGGYIWPVDSRYITSTVGGRNSPGGVARQIPLLRRRAVAQGIDPHIVFHHLKVQMGACADAGISAQRNFLSLGNRLSG